MFPTCTRLARRALLAAAVIFTATAASAYAQSPLTAGFQFSPATPAPGETVTFQSTTTGGGTGALELAWDLDGDGQFDDGTGEVAQRAYEAGSHVVRLRARRAGPGEPQDVEERTLVVAVPPAPTPTPTATPTVTPSPGVNQAPRARIDPDCKPTGLGTFCSGALARVNAPKTFRATGSADPDGQIVRHEWDLDGNGSFETDTGAEPSATHTYLDMKRVTIHLRVTDDAGATAEAALELKKLEPACQPSMTFRHVQATGPCLRRYHVDGGDKILMPNGTFKSGPDYIGNQYRSTLPIDLNGINIWPAKGKAIVINVLDHGDGPKLELVGQAVATIKSDGGTIKVDEQQIRWRLAGDRLLDVEKPAGGSIGGLSIAGMPAPPELRLGGSARFGFLLKLPAQFGAPTSDKPVVVTTGGGVTASAAGTPLSFEVANASIGPVGLDKLTVSYDGDDFWEIEAGVTLPPPIPYTIEGSAGIRDGKFAHAGAEVSFGTPGVGPFGPVFLQRIKFRVEVNPKKSECVPAVGLVEFVVAGRTYSIDWGVPTFALCGEVGLTAGPTILEKAALRLDGGLGFATFDDRPAIMRAFGTVHVVDVKLVDALLEVHGDGYIKAAADFKYGWEGLASVKGYMLYEMLGAKFNAEAGIEACLDFVDFCRGGKAIVSSKGIAVCIVIDYGLDDWRPGIGYKWGDSSPDLYFSGCSLGPYRAQINRATAAQTGERSIDIAEGLPGAAIAAVGRDAAPKITLIGPKGERITTPDDLMPVDQRPFFVLKDPRAKLTQVAITKPSPGRWRVITEEGSSPVTSLKVANGLEAPDVHARVTGSGHRRALVYRVDPRRGQKVRFMERGPSTGGRIGVAKGARGRIRFSPADGAAESREIVALVEQDGMPRDQIAVARYAAPSAARPAKPRGVRIARRGSTLRVGWKRDGAPRHVVAVTLSNGRRVVEQVSGRRHVVRGVRRGLRGRATVRAIGANGMLGPVGRARLR
jgi:PKD repeat protein